MKIKIRPNDAGALEENGWPQMSGWLAELRDDGQADPARDSQAAQARGRQADPARDSQAAQARGRQAHPASDSQAGQARGRQAHPARDGYASVSHGDPRSAAPAAAPPNRRPAPAPARARARTRASTPAVVTERAVIGDQLRIPNMWCEMGSCISRHADPAALGEADIRARAIRAGWRVDALGRLACPQCQQTAPGFRATRAVVLWDRATAIAMAARMQRFPQRAAGRRPDPTDRR